MNPQQYHLVFVMKDEYKRTVGFDLEYFGPGDNVPFERYRKHDRVTIRQRIDQAVKQRKLIFAKESDRLTALLLLMRDGNIKIPRALLQVGYRVGQDIYSGTADQDQNQHYFMVDQYIFEDIEILRMSPRVKDPTPVTELDLIDVVQIGFRSVGVAHYGQTEKMIE